MCVTRINLGLIINAGMLFSLNQEAHLRWTRDRSRVNWEEFVHYQVRANETYSEAKRQVSRLLSLWCSSRVRHCLCSLRR